MDGPHRNRTIAALKDNSFYTTMDYRDIAPVRGFTRQVQTHPAGDHIQLFISSTWEVAATTDETLILKNKEHPKFFVLINKCDLDL